MLKIAGAVARANDALFIPTMTGVPAFLSYINVLEVRLKVAQSVLPEGQQTTEPLAEWVQANLDETDRRNLPNPDWYGVAALHIFVQESPNTINVLN